MTTYKKLDAWKQSMQIITDIYQLTRTFPREEMFGLTSQMRRAAISVPANIVEGIGRNYKKDTVQFLHIARGSLYEIETLLEIAINLGYLGTESTSGISELINKTIKTLNGLIRYYEKADLK
ncbi:MAG: four helix bundle protein [Chitinophagaceae bacterium]|nr:four helix bundle protein [Chitinophagaceae bacterium]